MRRFLRKLGHWSAEYGWIFVYSFVVGLYHDHIIELRTFPPTVGGMVSGITVMASVIAHDWAVKNKP